MVPSWPCVAIRFVAKFINLFYDKFYNKKENDMATITIDRKNEMVSVSEATRHLANLLAQLRGRVASKYFLTKNNAIEAVLLPIEEYEKLLALEEELDQLILFREIDQRQSGDSGRRITLAELDEQYGLEG
jgi:PHD/YefM family antitoxin component YafN of YafNO toxin-antitoxin module